MEEGSQAQNLKWGRRWTRTLVLLILYFPITSHLFCLNQEFMFFESEEFESDENIPFFSDFLFNVPHRRVEIHSLCLSGSALGRAAWDELPLLYKHLSHSVFQNTVQCSYLLDHPWLLFCLSNSLNIYPVLLFIVSFLFMCMPISSVWLLTSLRRGTLA